MTMSRISPQLLDENVGQSNEEGATAVEYGLMVALISVAIVVTVGLLGTGLDGIFDRVLQTVNAA